ncbi:hypothetical protein T11_9317 [Trichinella zimbabwensis]|uniref:Uncharacterized protein n=1 Tax=Trichinella zimbabwensis TaxID=268475 RepID=A0A0V1GDG4_9BILA|nr:hypothetical protein T11_9317 [Trichinella zimbabwensis]
MAFCSGQFLLLKPGTLYLLHCVKPRTSVGNFTALRLLYTSSLTGLLTVQCGVMFN